MTWTSWPPELTDRCKVLWGKTSSRRIAEIITEETGRPITFNAVICQMNRIGLSFKGVTPMKSRKRRPHRSELSPKEPESLRTVERDYSRRKRARARATATATAVAYFIAVPGDDQASGIYGIGTFGDAAVQDAYEQSNSCAPSVYANEEGTWFVSDEGRDELFGDESEARAYAIQKGFISHECTERLYRHIEQYGCDASTFRWSQTVGGLDDLDVDQEHVDAAIAEVEAGFEGCTAQDTWTADEALTDAHDYVDAYVVDDETVDAGLREALRPRTQLRTAVDLAVRDIMLAEIAELQAA